jgi:hypothetical protein
MRRSAAGSLSLCPFFGAGGVDTATGTIFLLRFFTIECNMYSNISKTQKLIIPIKAGK